MPPRDLLLSTRRRYAQGVRAILTIDDDVVEAARCIANDESMSVGTVISRLARTGLKPRQSGARVPRDTGNGDAPG